MCFVSASHTPVTLRRCPYPLQNLTHGLGHNVLGNSVGGTFGSSTRVNPPLHASRYAINRRVFAIVWASLHWMRDIKMML